MILLKLTCKNCGENHLDTADFLGDCTIRKCPHCNKIQSDFAIEELGEVEKITTIVKVKGSDFKYCL